MASPAPAAIQAIQAHVSDWTGTDAEIAAALNAELVAPEDGPEPQLPVLSLMQMFARVSPETANKILDWPNLPLLRGDVLSGAREPVLNWLLVFKATGKMTEAEYAGVYAYLTTPEAPENGQVPWSVATLGRRVDAEDVAAARPGG